MLEDDFDVDIDELEMRMLEAEMQGEEILTSYDPYDYERIDDEQINSAIRFVEYFESISDPEQLLVKIENMKNKDS